MNDLNASLRYDANKKSLLIAYLLWWFFGLFGGHRFYLGRTGSAVAMLLITLVSFVLMLVFIGFLTVLISVIWAIVDAFLIPGMTQEWNNRLVGSLIPQEALFDKRFADRPGLFRVICRLA